MQPSTSTHDIVTDLATDLRMLLWAAECARLSPIKQIAYLRQRAAELERAYLKATVYARDDFDAEPYMASELCHQTLKGMADR